VIAPARIRRIRQAAGSLLVVGLKGAELSGDEREWLNIVRPGGIILFKRNIADAAQTRRLLDGATSLCAASSVRCVDLEGGTVNRLRDALAPLPSAQAVAAAARDSRKPELPVRHGELVARAVQAFGFNTTLAPVLDLGTPASAGVLGTRTAGADAAQVTQYAKGFFKGLKSHGMAGCGKHFPGLGGASGDTHLLTPSIDRSYKQLWNEDITPYRELCATMPMVMVNHAAYPSTQGKERPASVSKFWITSVLRNRIGYRGIIFSDDFEMGGILRFLPIEEAVIAALRAGMDMIEICHSSHLIVRSYEAAVKEAERSQAFADILLERARSVSAKRARIYAKSHSRALTQRQWTTLHDEMLRFNEFVAEAQAADRTATAVEAS
jgi:beta-N-acetylhexosaminidase